MKKINLLVAVSVICVIAMSSCKSDVQKAAESYFALEQLPKYQLAGKLVDAEITGSIKVIENEKEVVYAYENFEYFVELDKENIEMQKQRIKDVQESMEFRANLGLDADPDLDEQMADSKERLEKAELSLKESIATYDSLKATNAVYAYVYPCVQTITTKLNGEKKEVTDTIYMYIDKENKVLKMTESK